MTFKLYSLFAIIAIISGIIALVRITLGHDAIEAVRYNIVIGSVCLVMVVVLFRRERRQIERRT